MQTLPSYLSDTWVTGSGTPTVLHNPTTEEPVAQAATGGFKLGEALAYAREHGNKALRAMTFADRGQILNAVAQVMHEHREELLDLAVQNCGNTRSDAKFDLDGASATLAYYAKLGETLGAHTLFTDGEPAQLSKNPRFVGRHVWQPQVGCAVHINAFNFPAWGFAEKAAVAWLAGMPVFTKPATSTALVTARLVEHIVAKKILPKGALTFLAGSAGDLLTHLKMGDVVAFTGSSDTGASVRAMPNIIRNNVRVNIEADSLNAAVLGPDLTTDSDAYHLFLREVARDMTQKAGQKCTAIRRILVPQAMVNQVVTDLGEALAAAPVGDPNQKEVKVGPLATAQQLRDVQAGIERLKGAATPAWGTGGREKLVGINGPKGYFVSPMLFLTADSHHPAIHSHEVFGPVATVLPYDGKAPSAAAIVAKGEGGLVCSVYSDDEAFITEAALALSPYHGRLHLAGSKIAEHSLGPGTVLPQLNHGGPGRAGGGEELGGLRSLRFYMQRTALQGYAPTLERIVGSAPVVP